MWQIDNRTPFAVAQSWVRDRNGAEVWLVVVKCTFDIRPDGSTEISTTQAPVIRSPEYYGEPGASSIRFDTDFALTKTTTDIVVVGHAHAPLGEPVTKLDVGFRVGSVEKLLRVFGDRGWEGSSPSAPAPFISMPLTYERAFGGVDRQSDRPQRDWEWRNPVGAGFAVTASSAHERALPNIEYPDQLIQSWQDRPNPAGFGVIGSSWQPRASLAGTYDDNWAKARQPLLPVDLEDRFFQCVPEDQQSRQFLIGGEAVALQNLNPVSSLRFSLPHITLALETHFMDGERRAHEASKLHTVILEPDLPRVSLVWHSALECHAKVYGLERTRVELVSQNLDDGGEPQVDNLLDIV